MARMWWTYDEDEPVDRPTIEVDDVPLMQPIGFIWHSKPRYRVKAVGRKIQGASSRPERD